MSMINEFNTGLSPEQERGFWQWVTESSSAAGRDLGMDLHDYDLRGYWAESQGGGAKGHFTDRFKKPNHPTFSNESRYHGNKYQGGVWGHDRGMDTFTPSRQMLTDPNQQQYLRDYFRRAEPDAELILPD